MKRILCLLAALCLLLSGCNWMDGNYSSVQPHKNHGQAVDSSEISAKNYTELLQALQELIAEGKEKAVIHVGEYDQELLEAHAARAAEFTATSTPLGAYAVERIHYDLGTSGGAPALALEITYRHSRIEILQVRPVEDMEAVRGKILEALDNFQVSLVLLVDHYGEMDVAQLVEDYADSFPQTVMEVPQVSVGIYPESGIARILELKFSYQNSRDALRQMRTQVADIFDSADLYISHEDTDHVKFSQLYGFLMERFEYQFETSLTPAYSLLRHGVGDSEAFACVYAALCRQAGLECLVVTGTCHGQSRYWNIVLDGENYFHVDLQRCSELGSFQEWHDGQMNGYVWDYSAYPACPEVLPTEPPAPPQPEPTEPESEETEPDESLPPEAAEDPTGDATDNTEENTEI